jgi:hypothetical protein
LISQALQKPEITLRTKSTFSTKLTLWLLCLDYIMTRLHNFSNNNKNVGSKSCSNCNTNTTSVAPNDDLALDMLLKASGLMYEANPSLILKAFEHGGTFSGLDLSTAAKLEIVKDICEIHQLSDRCKNKLNTLCVAKFGGGI